MGEYAPRSPDLTGLYPQPKQSQESFSYDYPPPPPIRNDSFSTGSSSHYHPPQLKHQQSSTAYSHSSLEPPFAKLESLLSWQSQPDSQPAPQARRPGRPKREPSIQDSKVTYNADGTPQVQTGKVRKPSMKKEQPPPPEPGPRLPAPGDKGGIVVKTKFPVARIKRIVQADEEVGKVATGTPVAVGKALELFMIQMTLAAITEASERGVKRLTAQNIKTAINKDDKFDFLKDIGDKIPDGHPGRNEGKGRIAKMERGTSEEDVEMDDLEQEAPKSAKKRPGRKRRLED